MSVSSAAPPPRPSLPQWVGSQYYRHGLFCASHPYFVLLFTLTGVLWACIPLLTLPIYSGGIKIDEDSPKANDILNGEGAAGIAHWRQGLAPLAYLQQVHIKAMVSPYRPDELIRTDAFRGPLASAFKLHLEDLVSFRTENK